MDVTFLPSDKTLPTLRRLVAECESMQWAVASVTTNPAFLDAMAHRAKFEHLVIGTHLYQTDPDVLDQAAPMGAAAVVPPTGDLFHPKVYLFKNGRRVRAVVGSPNLTHGAMYRNVEASVLIDGTDADQALVDLQAFVADAFTGAADLTDEFRFQYRHQWAAKRDARDELTRFATIRPPKQRGTNKAPHDMSWTDYLAQVRSPTHPSAHLFQERLGVLAKARQLFASGQAYDQWAEDDRKLVAGTLGRKKSQQPGVDYALFGSMTASGTFATTVMNAPGGLSKALDCIPSMGTVSERDFDKFCKHYATAFDPSGRQGRLPPATRLLAMKRPDVFICVDNANKKDLCDHFGVAPSTTDLDNYWERLIEPMQQTAWWRHAVPTNHADAEIWHGRAALLDAIYYEGSA